VELPFEVLEGGLGTGSLLVGDRGQVIVALYSVVAPL
jgi:hypothetical protein